MERKIYVTDDGSHTMAIPDRSITYHSTFGAIQESLHVFIGPGLLRVMEDKTGAMGSGAAAIGRELAVFEMGFGTGLNALLTLREAFRHRRPVHYQTVEPDPLSEAEAGRLNYIARLKDESLRSSFALLHSSLWNQDVTIHPFFSLSKIQASITDITLSGPFHVIYYDAFAPDVQPHLWTPEIYEKLYRSLHPGGVLVTYCCKGIVRRELQAVGFTVEKLPGPRGKREILRAIKA